MISRLSTLRRRLFLVALISTIIVSSPVWGQSTPPGDSPDDLWQILEEVEFPPRYSAPTEFTALSLDAALLESLLAGAPREDFGPIPPQAQLWIPLASGRFAQVSVAQSQMMEGNLASQFPQIKTYVFSGEGVAGHIAVGPEGVHLAALDGPDIRWIQPVETATGRVYVSYLDRNRTDGANVIEHDPHMGEGDNPPVPLVPPGAGANAAQLLAGEQLRIYRLAASTTGEFYQARGNNDFSVIFSLIVDLIGANAVFEPEVSVRLILAAASLDLLYDDPGTDPFDNSDSACTLRQANRTNMQNLDANGDIEEGDYDLGFLFAARSGGGANGCAWYVVCLADHQKARGAGKMGNNGANSASGLLAHEVGHQLGARHTFTGQAGSCTLNEFQAGDSESGYEPGSGTTRMSYNGNCADQAGDPPPPPPPPLQNDNVDTSVVPAGSYFHSRSFDEIVDNVFNGDGASCGTLVNTGNTPPTVNAGPDYTIPRQTPFMLTGTGMDSEPLTFNWEQFDRAEVQRPINTDPGDGPIIRSVPPTADSSRTVPHLPDLLDNMVRRGEILPQVDRELNFRLIARDNLMGGGGVTYDSMHIDVQGDPFFITAPNSGALEAGCTVPLTWQVGGGSVAPQVEALFSSDGGLNFDTPLTGPIANDGADSFTVPCQFGGPGRIKLQSVDNIFFDVNNENLTVFNTPPAVQVNTAGGSVDNNCEFTVQFSAEAVDSCGLNAADVEVELFKAVDNFTLGTPTINVVQVNPNQVDVTGSVQVSDLLGSPAQLAISVVATDGCGALSSDFAEALIVDDTPPEIDVALDRDTLWPPNHKLVPIEASVVATDNCPVVNFTLTQAVSNEPENGQGDGNTAPDIVGAELGTADLEFSLRSERAGAGSGRIYTVTYTAVDGSDNAAESAATVEVPKSQ